VIEDLYSSKGDSVNKKIQENQHEWIRLCNGQLARCL